MARAVKIMLDPGHDKAKYNQGAAPGYWEGERMWRLYQFLRPALEKRGFVVGCTKSRCDQAVTVTQRGRMSRGYAALISLHSNACADPKVDRPVGIYFVDDDCGKIDEESKEMATRLSKVVAVTMDTRGAAQQYSRKTSSDRDGDGKKNDDYYGVLYSAHQVGVPAIILEHSFHTNEQAALWLMSDANLRKLAEAEAQELAEYYGMNGAAPAPAPTTKKEGTPVQMKNLKPGDTGNHVKVMQALLIGYGYSCGKSGADGSYGPATKTALGKYQEEHKDPSTGKPLKKDYSCGPATWRSLLAQ